jgi:hypothetical protein
MEALFLHIWVEDLYAKMFSSDFTLLAHDLKTFHVIKYAESCKLLHSAMDSVQKLCIENYMKIKFLNKNIIYFTRKTNSIIFSYYVGDVLIVRPDSIKDL